MYFMTKVPLRCMCPGWLDYLSHKINTEVITVSVSTVRDILIIFFNRVNFLFGIYIYVCVLLKFCNLALNIYK